MWGLTRLQVNLFLVVYLTCDRRVSVGVNKTPNKALSSKGLEVQYWAWIIKKMVLCMNYKKHNISQSEFCLFTIPYAEVCEYGVPQMHRVTRVNNKRQNHTAYTSWTFQSPILVFVLHWLPTKWNWVLVIYLLIYLFIWKTL